MRSNRIHPSLLLVPVLVALACDSSPTGLEPQLDTVAESWLASYSIVDGTDPDGTAGFRWLPPVASGGSELSSDLDPAVLPLLTVEVCEWDGEGCVGDPVASFDSEEPDGIRIAEDDEGSEHFMTLWRVRSSEVEAGKSYRVRVLVDGVEVGHADAVVSGRGGAVPPEDRGEYVVVRLRQTLPIKFRVTEELEVTAAAEPAGEGDDGPAVAIVVNRFSDDVTVVDVTTSSVTATIPVGDEPMAAAFGPDGRAYVANYGGNDMSVVDVETASAIGTISVGANPQAVAVSVDGGTAVVANAGSDDLSVIDLSSETVTSTVPVCDLPQSVALSPDGATAYVACPRTSSVAVVDLAGGVVSSTVTVGSSPRGVALSPDGSIGYTANFGSGDVSIIDVASGTVTGAVGVGAGPISVTVAPDGSAVWVPNQYSANVSVIDAGSGAVSATVATGSLPASVGITADGATAYVATMGDDSVSVVDVGTGTVIATLSDGGGPDPRGRESVSPGPSRFPGPDRPARG